MAKLWWPVVLYMAAIFMVSSTSRPPMPSVVPDLWMHALAYLGLGLLLARATAGGRWHGVTRRTLLVAWAIAVAYGVSDEWHQSFVPNRQMDPRDVAADAIGALASVLLVGAWGIIRRS
jgi:VanZ family protein